MWMHRYVGVVSVQVCVCGCVAVGSTGGLQSRNSLQQQRNWDDEERSEGPKRKEGGREGKEVGAREDQD